MPKDLSHLSPCTLAKARLALGLPGKYRGNSKHFSKPSWEKTIQLLVSNHTQPIPPNIIQAAIDNYEYYLNLRELR